MLFAELNKRSLEIFRELVDAYIETGEPVGSRTLSRRLALSLSPATVRNVMADLEEAGLLYAPHTSAGRLPTEEGMRFFVHGLLERGDIGSGERVVFEGVCLKEGRSFNEVLDEATTLLSGLSQCAGLVLAPKTESRVKQIEFVSLSAEQALLVLITEDGLIENRLLQVPSELPPSALATASNYLNARLHGRTLNEARAVILKELTQHKAYLDDLVQKVVEEGLAVWGGQGSQESTLIVKGQNHLLTSITEVNELEKIRHLFSLLDTKEEMVKVLDASIQAQGIQIFIGAENNLFDLAGCSVVVSPYKNSREQVIGAIGVVGPTRMNYRKIIPLVDYTAKLIAKLLK